MKYFIFIILISIGFVSCEKANDVTPESPYILVKWIGTNHIGYTERWLQGYTITGDIAYLPADYEWYYTHADGGNILCDKIEVSRNMNDPDGQITTYITIDGVVKKVMALAYEQ